MRVTVVAVAGATLALGFVIGMLVGLSQSPVVGLALPILFSVVGGTSGFYFAKVNLNTKTGRQGVQLASLAVLLMSAGTLGGVWSGIETRTRDRSWSMLSLEPEALFPSGELASGEAIEWVLLDAKLQLMGLGPSERRIMIQRLHPKSRPIDGDEFRQEISWLAKSFELLVPEENILKYRNEWVEFYEKIRSLQQLIVSSKVGTSPAVFATDVENLLSEMDLLTDDDDDQDYLEKNPAVTASLSTIRLRLKNLATATGGSASAVRLANDRLDEFLSGDHGDLTTLQALAGGPEGFIPES